MLALGVAWILDGLEITIASSAQNREPTTPRIMVSANPRWRLAGIAGLLLTTMLPDRLGATLVE